MNRTAAVQISEHVAQDTIKPREQVLVVRERTLALERPQQTFLHRICRELIVTKSSSSEALKRGQIGEERRR